jgi:hypothetical protein
MPHQVKGNGTREDPWILTTPSGGSEYSAYRDESAAPPALVAQVGKTEVRYQLRALDDLQVMLKSNATGCPSAALTRASPPRTAPWGRGRGPRTTGRRLVRPEEGPARPARELRPTGDGSPWPRGGRTPAEKQPHACPVGRASGNPSASEDPSAAPKSGACSRPPGAVDEEACRPGAGFGVRVAPRPACRSRRSPASA